MTCSWRSDPRTASTSSTGTPTSPSRPRVSSTRPPCTTPSSTPGTTRTAVSCARPPARPNPGGRVLLGFSSIGNVDVLRVLAAESGQKLTLFRSQGREVDTVVIEFQMRELTAE
ncbi:hypothetical protein NQP46_09205 [Streptomyces albus]|nr:hypothetical protein NQP46_09205 [Streptomyces albus]